MPAPDQSRPPLQAMSLLSASFSVLGQRLPLFFLLAFVPSLAITGLQILMIRSAIYNVEVETLAASMFIIPLVEIGVSVLVGFFIFAILTVAAYDTALDRPVRLGAYIGQALRALPVVVLVGVVLYLAVLLGLLLVILPGLYLIARYAVTTPAIMVERAGLGALSRSAELTQGYRWPIAGLFVLIFLLVVVLGAAVTLATGLLIGMVPSEPGLLLVAVLNALTSTVQYAVLSVFGALLYARLRQIKDGMGMDDLVEVFA